MRIGQTALVSFVSNSAASIIGFLGTIYFARVLGADVLGIYALVLALVSWLAVVGDAGLVNAIGKRLSEGRSRAEHFSAGLLLLIAFYTAVSLILFSFRHAVEGYIGRPVIVFIVLILFAHMLSGIVNSTLIGYHLVHIQGILNPLRIATRSLLQIGLVFLGFELAGLLGGYVLGFFAIGLVGLLVASPSVALPSKKHFRSLLQFARYSWLSSVQSKTFGWIDVAVLGFFVSSELIGVYSVGWTISTFLLASGSAISGAIFPEISKIASEEGADATVSVVRDAMTYAGVFLIPGFVGSLVLGDRILRLFGPEFVQGTTILYVLIVACLVYGYLRQHLTTLDAVDRPNLTFRVYVVFILSNVLFNVALVYRYGWTGAAVATAISAALALVLAHYYLSRVIDVTPPIGEFGRQWIAAAIMGVVIFGGVQIEDLYGLIGHNAATVVLLVLVGAGIYFLTLLGISSHFRGIVRSNVPTKVREVLR